MESIKGCRSSVDLRHFAGQRLRKHRHPLADLSFDFFLNAAFFLKINI